MKKLLIILILLPLLNFGQQNSAAQAQNYVKSVENLTIEGAFELTRLATNSAAAINKNVSIAILDASGTTLLLVKGTNVGPHNTEASRRKAFTALSTKTASFELMEKAAADVTANNLNTLPELLLLGGGAPIWKDNVVIGSIGVSGAGGGLQDHNVAKEAVEALGFSIHKK